MRTCPCFLDSSCCCLWLSLCRSAHSIRAAEPVSADLLLKGGTLHDGSGKEPVVGDVAIHDGKIVAVGTFEIASVEQTIDCAGLVIAPGFIDLHNHSDSQMVDRATRANVNFLMQGCTTIVTGNCGSGPVDVAEYFEKIDREGAGTHVIHLLPQGSLRSQVIGSVDRAPTTEELAKMKDLAEKAMRDGAWGMSTGTDLCSRHVFEDRGADRDREDRRRAWRDLRQPHP